MTSIVVPAQTGELRRRWLIATIAAAVVAAAIPVVAGGPWAWVRILAGIVTIAGFTLAAFHHRVLEIPVVVALLSVLTVSDAARVDRAIVAFPTAIAVLVAIECTVITRRLVTAAPVSSTAHDAVALAGNLLAATIAGAIVVGLAQLDTFELRALAVGATVALAVVAVVVRGDESESD